LAEAVLEQNHLLHQMVLVVVAVMGHQEVLVEALLEIAQQTAAVAEQLVKATMVERISMMEHPITQGAVEVVPELQVQTVAQAEQVLVVQDYITLTLQTMVLLQDGLQAEAEAETTIMVAEAQEQQVEMVAVLQEAHT
jgi:hypothetical protein